MKVKIAEKNKQRATRFKKRPNELVGRQIGELRRSCRLTLSTISTAKCRSVGHLRGLEMGLTTFAPAPTKEAVLLYRGNLICPSMVRLSCLKLGIVFRCLATGVTRVTIRVQRTLRSPGPSALPISNNLSFEKG